MSFQRFPVGAQLLDDFFSSSHLLCQLGADGFRLSAFPWQVLAGAPRNWPPVRALPSQESHLCVDQADSALAIFDGGGCRHLAERNPGRRGIQNADRFVRQLAAGNVTVRQSNRRIRRLIQNAHVVVRL